jgi:hypothetical protein
MGQPRVGDPVQTAGDLLERDEALSKLVDSLRSVQRTSSGCVVIVNG